MNCTFKMLLILLGIYLKVHTACTNAHMWTPLLLLLLLTSATTPLCHSFMHPH